MSKARIILEDGTVYEGKSFGYERSVSGEVVFNTAMTGYPESLTDPSYVGQILVMTYPLVGNYGVPERTRMPNGLSRYMESEKIHIEGLVVFDHSPGYSHWNALDSLDQWLKEERIPGVYDIDTRALTKLLREKGSLKGKLVIGDDDPDKIPFTDPNSINQVERVSCREVIMYQGTPGSKKVVLPDCGVKHNIIRCLLKRGVTVIRVPWNYDFNTIEHDGIFISNGPGNPSMCVPTVEHLKRLWKETSLYAAFAWGTSCLVLPQAGKSTR